MVMSDSSNLVQQLVPQTVEENHSQDPLGLAFQVVYMLCLCKSLHWIRCDPTISVSCSWPLCSWHQIVCIYPSSQLLTKAERHWFLPRSFSSIFCTIEKTQLYFWVIQSYRSVSSAFLNQFSFMLVLVIRQGSLQREWWAGLPASLPQYAHTLLEWPRRGQIQEGILLPVPR